ncbi:TraI/MobA(P) family conjugative relaxase [Agrobacterium tumefaciens]|uniref:TraI/MobA(P) family conjugative relaxase n=1 Tax=Agrobacterium tumefaciens TaxID=358 RepID=UPI001573FFAB|nr:TraI/MobA(P) family conjugative relaxase [Agrobacterium tumefaciens]NTB05857.1 relaxase/mobilization nuclease domain-containing protein [Agrobacterium tumefaciens]
MIVKIAPNRRDGKSSFQDLSKYIVNGIEQSGTPPTKTSWDSLTQYITAESVLNELGENVEKTIGVEIGNVMSLATAAAEMYAVANKAHQVKNPVYHYILSWPEHERPSTQDIFAAARDTLRALGMEEHQYIIAIHANTDNLHAHIEVNRVHPKTFKPQYLNWDHATLHEAARHAEIKYGWHHDNGIFQVVEVNGKKHVVRNTEYLDPDLVPTRPGAHRAEVWSGEESLETWCKGVPATDLRRVLDDDTTSSWQDVHRVLARHGLELVDTGGGGFKVLDVSPVTDEKDGKPVAVRASAAFRFLKRKDLEERFGVFEKPAADLKLEEPARTYKRDPHKRLESRLARKALRDDLKKRFKEADREARARQAQVKELLKPFADADKARYDQLQEAYKAQRAAIRQDTRLSPAQKQQMYMLARLSMQKARNQLSSQISGERTQRRELLPPVASWRAWVEEQAALGDEAAISALRGMVYQDGRDLKKKIARDAAQEEQNAIRPAIAQDTDPQARRLADLVWKVSKNGNVHYAFGDGQPAFRDEGDRLTFGRKEVTDEALALTLRYGADKWRDGVHITGGDFAFKERAVRQAVELGIKVRNIELRGLEAQIKAEAAAMSGRDLAGNATMPAGARIESTLVQAVSLRDDDIDELVRGVNRRAKIVEAIAEDKTYAGRIVAQNARYIAQDIGRNEFVVHERSAFAVTPEHGQHVSVRYRAGKATATAVKGRPTLPSR